MPTYKVTDPQTGRTLRLTGDSPPTEQELNEVFSQYQPKQAVSEQPKPVTKGENFTNFLGALSENVTNRLPGVGFSPPKEVQAEMSGLPLEAANMASAGMLRPAMRSVGMDIPEQKTLTGKVARGVGGAMGFGIGIPGKAAASTAGMVRGVLSPRIAKTIAGRMAQGAAGGAVGGYLSGDTLEGKAQGAKLGGILGGVAPAIAPVAKKVASGVGRGMSALSGVSKETFEETGERGFRNVLQKKYYNKKIPQQIQERIEGNLESLERASENKYDALTAPLKKMKFDAAEFRGKVSQIASKAKDNPFKTPEANLDREILDVAMNRAKLKNYGDALSFRRFLDNQIYSGKSELKSKFGKEVRDLLKEELHKNPQLKAVDADWTTLQNALREGRKVTGETGEKLLARFNSLTTKQKSMLSALEKEVGGEPFIDDLTNYSLAKDYTTKTLYPGLSGVIRGILRPATRGVLRSGEAITSGLNKLDRATIAKILGE